MGDSVTRGRHHAATVEAIGLRSTRIRTQERTLVTIPNGKLADMKVEIASPPRDRIRLACVLGLVYATSVAQLRTAVCSTIEQPLRAQPKIVPGRRGGAPAGRSAPRRWRSR